MSSTSEDVMVIPTGMTSNVTVTKAQVMAYFGLNDELTQAIEAAHMAGQADAGVDPGYSNAREYRRSMHKL